MAVSFFKKQNEPPKTGRIQRLTESELIQWVDNTILQLGYTFDQWRYHDLPLEDVSLHAATLNDLLKELLNRVVNQKN